MAVFFLMNEDERAEEARGDGRGTMYIRGWTMDVV